MKAVKLSIYFVARSLGLFGLFRWLTRSKVRILCYHGGSIGDEHAFNPLLFCRPELLDARLRWLRDKGFSVVPLDAAVTMLGKPGARPRLPVALTFDDGWLSTYACLHPVIAQHQVPATLYLCTGYCVEERPNLDVALSYILWKSGNPRVSIRGVDAALDGEHDLSTPEVRQRFIEAARRWLSGIEGRERVNAACEGLAAQLGVAPEVLDLGSRRFDFADPEELREMRTHGWTIELHGHVHRYPAGRPAELAADLDACRREIRKAGLPEASHYCYPSGNHDADAGRLLKGLGVASATTCLPGLIGRADAEQIFYLPRFLDGESVHALEFEAEMSGFADFFRQLSGRR